MADASKNQPSGAPAPGGTVPPAPRASGRAWLVLAAMIGAMWLWKATAESNAAPPVPYSQFFNWVKDGKVLTAVIAGDAVDVTLKDPQKVDDRPIKSFHTNLPANDPALLPLLRDKGVLVTVKSQQQPFAVQMVLTLLPWILIFAAWTWMSRRARGMLGAGGPLAGLISSPSRKFEKTNQVNVTFEDIAGLKAAKNDLLEIVQFLKEPERFARLGGKVPRGVLLVGPPGTGKTLLARAVAGESGVPFFSISGSEFIELFVGLGAARVRELFKEVKKSAPAIVFIDEIDAVGRSRGAGLGGGNDEREQTLNQLLSEMDGFNRSDLVVVMAATNRPDVLDPALLRPGRFDRRVLVDRPELSARKAILAVHLRGKPVAKDVDLEVIAENSAGFSGADLANLVNEAALSATRAGRESITSDDFAAAFDKIVLGDPRETMLGVKEKKRVAVHESGHALVAHLSPDVEPPHRISIIPRGMALGFTHQLPGTDRHVMAEAELAARIRVLMGGFAAERVVLGGVSTGAENDLKEATRLASRMVANFGMSQRLGPVYYEHETEHPFLGARVALEGATSPATVAAIEDEARKILSRALDEATQLLLGHREDLDRLGATLFERESLDHGELDELLGPRPTVEDEDLRQWAH
ncbi:MAG TPA: ATP-dependent zinc metalloprotease FtsH [Polyangia bacterium]|jgi:cell division protease FtsH|nr:ATP-dependent zinc metalloprotease FtsH [Polyangia bacterium]